MSSSTVTRVRRLLQPSGALSLGAALVVAVALGSGCALFLKRPSARIAEVRIGSVGLLGATAEVMVAVSNPNGFDLTAEEIRYRLSFADAGAEGGWRTLVEGSTEDERNVPAGDSAELSLSLPFRYEDVGRAVASLLGQGELRYRVEGDVKFDVPGPNLRVPFDRQGTLVP